MPQPYRVVLLGFDAQERSALMEAIAAPRSHGFGFDVGAQLLPMLDDADFVIADADDGPSVQLVVVTERVGDTLFIGHRAPPFGAAAWLPRPVEAAHLLRELDALVAPLLGDGQPEPAVAGPVDGPRGGPAGDAPRAATGLLDVDLNDPSMPPFPALPPVAGDSLGSAANPVPAASLPAQPPQEPTPARAAALAPVLRQPASPAPAPGLPQPEALASAAPVAPVAPGRPAPAPRAAPAAVAPMASPPGPPAPARLRAWMPRPGSSRLRALVVDDSETARQHLRTRLEAWGLEVQTAASSGQALALLFRQHFDHLFIDVELGAGSQLDGLGLCQLVRRKNLSLGGAPELVVIVSAHHGHLDRARGTLAGCDAYLGKPLDEADLGALLRRQGLQPLASEAGDTPS